MEITPEILKKYACGQCTKEEELLVREWLDTLEDIAGTDLEGQEVAEDRMWKIINRSTKERKVNRGSGSIHSIGIWLTAACLTALAGLVIYQWIFSEPYRRYETGTGETRAVTLQDGTEIILNAESRLTVPTKFEDSARVVRLQGEGYFTVAQDPNHPFIIDARDSRVRVLGTKFNLSAYKSEPVTVTVNEGLVAFSNLYTGETLFLTFNEQGILLPDQAMDRIKTDPNKYNAWIRNKLVINDQPLEYIARQIERRYGVKVYIRDWKLSHERFTGSFDNPDLPSLLENLSFVIKFKYKIHDEKIAIYRNEK